MALAGDLMEVFLTHEIYPPMSFRFTSAGSQKTCAPLRAASVTITFEKNVWRACVVPLPDAMDGSIGGIMIGRVGLINNFVDNFRW